MTDRIRKAMGAWESQEGKSKDFPRMSQSDECHDVAAFSRY